MRLDALPIRAHRTSFLHGCPQAVVLSNSQHSINSAAQQQRALNKQADGNIGQQAESDLMATALSSRQLLSLIVVKCVLMHVCVPLHSQNPYPCMVFMYVQVGHGCLLLYV